MNTREPDVFETTLQKTNIWVKEVSDLLHWDDHPKAYHGLRAVLHVLRDRLPVNEAVHLGAQLPMLVRSLYYERGKPVATFVKSKTLPEFYEMIRHNFVSDRNVNPIRLNRSRDRSSGCQHFAGRIRAVTRNFSRRAEGTLAGDSWNGK
jgi:uncharacterized protein (DUF2267 family)